jgi:hypothetical protein
MVTPNPKVSAYVPQAIKDRLKQFSEEHDLSESQAVSAILAEYFGMTQVLGRAPEGLTTEGVTLARMEALEEKFASLTTSPGDIPSELLKKIDQLSTSVESLERRLEVVEQGGLLNRLKSELREADLLAAAKEIEEVMSQGELALEADSLPIYESVDNRQLELIEPVLINLPGEPLEEINPIPGTKLSELRFNLSQAAITGVKRKKSVEELAEWTRSKDPDGIAWKFVDSPKGYVPAEELSSEQKSSLLEWIKQNL